ncbi:MAG: hypothetical protein HY606_06230 [Planctomycetes bacterium]|nr:hypothetical protein [Planctomycetota bacterium]
MKYGFMLCVLCGLLSCADNSGALSKIQDCDTIEFVSYVKSTTPKVDHTVTDTDMIKNLLNGILTASSESACKCDHGKKLVFKKGTAQLAEISYCGHCMILENGSHLQVDDQLRAILY